MLASHLSLLLFMLIMFVGVEGSNCDKELSFYAMSKQDSKFINLLYYFQITENGSLKNCIMLSERIDYLDSIKSEIMFKHLWHFGKDINKEKLYEKFNATDSNDCDLFNSNYDNNTNLSKIDNYIYSKLKHNLYSKFFWKNFDEFKSHTGFYIQTFIVCVAILSNVLSFILYTLDEKFAQNAISRRLKKRLPSNQSSIRLRNVSSSNFDENYINLEDERESFCSNNNVDSGQVIRIKNETVVELRNLPKRKMKKFPNKNLLMALSLVNILYLVTFWFYNILIVENTFIFKIIESGYYDKLVCKVCFFLMKVSYSFILFSVVFLNLENSLVVSCYSFILKDKMSIKILIPFFILLFFIPSVLSVIFLSNNIVKPIPQFKMNIELGLLCAFHFPPSLAFFNLFSHIFLPFIINVYSSVILISSCTFCKFSQRIKFNELNYKFPNPLKAFIIILLTSSIYSLINFATILLVILAVFPESNSSPELQNPPFFLISDYLITFLFLINNLFISVILFLPRKHCVEYISSKINGLFKKPSSLNK